MSKYTIIIFSLFVITLSCKDSNDKINVRRKNWKIAHEAIERVRIPFNKQSDYINEVYSDLSITKRDSNLKKLEQIKILSKEINFQSKSSLKIIRSELKNQDTAKIFLVTLKYLEKVKSIEPLLPSIYIKMEKDINGLPTERQNQIIDAANRITECGYLYKEIMENYPID
ncbi:MAG: hypothetical protein ACK4UK_01295 [Flavobacterium sp.]